MNVILTGAKRRNLLLTAIAHCLLLFAACSSDDSPPEENTDTPVLESSTPAANTTVEVTLQEVVLVFEQNIAVTNQSNITLNGTAVVGATAHNNTLTVQLGSLEAETAYMLTLAAGAIKAIPGVMNTEPITLAFHTAEAPPLSPALAVSNPSPEVVRLYTFLKENFGQKIISGTMANVNWNTNEAEWVHRHTGKYPALNGFDYIHHYASPSNWIDYGNTQVVEDWWNNNGIVTVMWHWNVPTTAGSSQYAFYTAETSFDISKAVQDGTYEHGVVIADLNAIADYLLLLQQKNIPVLWRPLHEAAGGWFWWGAKGAVPFKALWRLMFETFESKGLNNLIWVWTAEPNDDAWYPGDDYVDIVGRDIYNKTAATDMASEYTSLKNRFPNKIVTLSECGNVAKLSEQTTQGVRWSWFMPWYDYNRTNNPDNTAFDNTAHEHANIAWWNNAFNDPRVLSRDEISVKN
jgi:mannan endo-1,4-beta-mannosidase